MMPPWDLALPSAITPAAVLLLIFIMLSREILVTGAAHRRELAAATKTIDVVRAEMTSRDQAHAAEITAIRERHDNYVRILSENHAREIEGVRRDTADWRTAYHLAAEVSVTESAQLREIVEGVRLVVSVIESLPVTRHNHPRPGVIEANGTGPG